MLHPKKQDHFLPHLPTRIGTHSPTGNFGGPGFRSIMLKGPVPAGVTHCTNKTVQTPSQAKPACKDCNASISISPQISWTAYTWNPWDVRIPGLTSTRYGYVAVFQQKANNKPYVFVKEIDNAERQRQWSLQHSNLLKVAKKKMSFLGSRSFSALSKMGES